MDQHKNSFAGQGIGYSKAEFELMEAVFSEQI
jgi:hypothetical protein